MTKRIPADKVIFAAMDKALAHFDNPGMDDAIGACWDYLESIGLTAGQEFSVGYDVKPIAASYINHHRTK